MECLEAILRAALGPTDIQINAKTLGVVRAARNAVEPAEAVFQGVVGGHNDLPHALPMDFRTVAIDSAAADQVQRVISGVGGIHGAGTRADPHPLIRIVLHRDSLVR